jgi:hypothetical protein
MTKNSWISVVLFLGVQLAAVIYLFYMADPSLSFLGLPSWILGFIVIEMVYCAIMWWFIKNVWS